MQALSTVPVSAGASSWDVLLDQALSEVGLVTKSERKGAKLRALLGFSQCRVAVLTLSGIRETPDNLKQAIEAWVERQLHTSANEWVIRWEAIGSSGKYLVSCVRCDVLESLQAFSATQKLRLASVRPGVLEGLDRAAALQRKLRQPLLFIATEGVPPNPRDGVVQMFLLDQGALLQEWRGWAQPPQDDEDDLALEGLVRRFCATHAVAPAQTVCERWPADLALQD